MLHRSKNKNGPGARGINSRRPGTLVVRRVVATGSTVYGSEGRVAQRARVARQDVVLGGAVLADAAAPQKARVQQRPARGDAAGEAVAAVRTLVHPAQEYRFRSYFTPFLLSIYVSIYVSMYLCIYLCIYVSIYLCIYLSI